MSQGPDTSSFGAIFISGIFCVCGFKIFLFHLNNNKASNNVLVISIRCFSGVIPSAMAQLQFSDICPVPVKVFTGECTLQQWGSP